jgi:hypothetical protein
VRWRTPATAKNANFPKNALVSPRGARARLVSKTFLVLAGNNGYVAAPAPAGRFARSDIAVAII